jgi:hypothetical protein
MMKTMTDSHSSALVQLERTEMNRSTTPKIRINKEAGSKKLKKMKRIMSSDI